MGSIDVDECQVARVDGDPDFFLASPVIAAGPARGDAEIEKYFDPRALAGLGRYLHQRTGGMIGSLSHLIRGAAIEAILNGTEQITRQLLDGIGLDHAAESNAGRGQGRHR